MVVFKLVTVYLHSVKGDVRRGSRRVLNILLKSGFDDAAPGTSTEITSLDRGAFHGHAPHAFNSVNGFRSRLKGTKG